MDGMALTPRTRRKRASKREDPLRKNTQPPKLKGQHGANGQKNTSKDIVLTKISSRDESRQRNVKALHDPHKTATPGQTKGFRDEKDAVVGLQGGASTATKPKGNGKAYATRKATEGMSRRPRHERCRSPSMVVDIFAMEIPRRPRSRRSTTVVKLTKNFSFRDLPSLLHGASPSGKTQQEFATDQKAQEGEEKEERSYSKAPRKPKSDATPQRIVSSGPQEMEEQGESRRRRCRKFEESVGEADTLESEENETDDALFTPDERETSTRTLRRRRRAKTARGKTSRKTSRKQKDKVRSLSALIHDCTRKKNETNVEPRKLLNREETTVVEEPLTAEKPLVKTKPEKIPPPSTETHEYCPTISCLLTKGVIEVGDFVELQPVNSHLTIHGWVTHRGILCSHCAMVHTCKVFGECADCLGANNRIRRRDGSTFAQLME